MITMFRAGLALTFAIVISALTFAQERRAEITATYNGLNLPPVAPAKDGVKNSFSYQYTQRDLWLTKVGRGVVGSKGNSPAVGILDWTVPAEEFGTAGMDREFRTYCAEAPVPVTAGSTYKFEIKSPAVVEAYRLLDDNEAGRSEAIRRSQYIRELFGRYYIASLTDPKVAKAFQVALWEIIHEPTWGAPDKAAPLDLDSGSFTAAKAQADPETVTLATTYLKSLTGNDNLFYENPDLAGRELVWMKGLNSPLANNEVAQSQFALQYVRGGGVNVASYNGPTGGMIGGGGVPLGGLGGGGYGGGGGAYLGGGGGGGGAPSSTTTPPTTTPPTTTSTVPPVNSTSPPNGTSDIPTGTTGTPTTTQFSHDPTPVPAPAGLVLGLIAVGTFLGRRVYTRTTGKK